MLERIAFTGASFLQVPPPEVEVPKGEEPEPLPETVTISLGGPQSGMALFSWQDVNPDDIYSSGDVFTISLDGYGSEDFIYDGTMQLDNVEIQGLLGTGGVSVATADLSLLSLRVQVGSDSFTLNTTLPVRLERRVVTQLFDLYLLEDLVLADQELKAGNRVSRYSGFDELNYIFEGAVFSPALDGLIRFATPSVLTTEVSSGGGLASSTDPSEGMFEIFGADGSMIQTELGSTVTIIPGNIPPVVTVTTFTIRVDEDGDEEFEAEEQEATLGELLLK